MKRIRRFIKRICLGLAATAKMENANKINPIGATDFKARHGLPLKLATITAIATIAMAAIPAKAGDKSDKVEGLTHLLDAMSGKSSGEVIANDFAHQLELAGAAGAQQGGTTQAGMGTGSMGPFPSQLAIGPLSSTTGNWRWGTTLCDY